MLTRFALTVFDSIFLRRITALADETSLNSDSKYAARRVRGTIFHYDEIMVNDHVEHGIT